MHIELEIAPDEIFLDDMNVASFDRNQFEGRIERPLAHSVFLWMGTVLGLLFLILVVQMANLQIRHGAKYAAMSAENSLEEHILFAKRGIILDRNGVPLVTNQASEDGFVRRVYEREGVSSLLGYVSYPKKDSSGNYYSTDIEGLAGVEAAFDSLLAGVNGRLLVEEDARGQVQSEGTVVPPRDGEPLTLSIDTRVQDAFYHAIKELADRVPYTGGTGMLMDVATGELLALASYPEYDSNIVSTGQPRAVIASYATDARHPYLNRALQGLYTPGSVVKPLEAAGALTDGVADPAYTITDTKGYLSIPNPYNPDSPTLFRDWRVQGVVDLRKAIAVSSDIYFYIMGGGYGDRKGLGIERLAYWYRSFGLDTETGIDVPSERVGFVPTPAWKEETYGEDWTIGNTYHTAIGQYAMQVTPLAMLRATAAIANGGTLVIPTIRKRGGGESVATVAIPASPESLQIVREGMRQGVLEGTSAGLSSYESLVHLAGKTGTAQLGARNEYHHSWAVGFFPYENPKYAYAVLMDKGPSNNTLGGVYVMSQVLAELRQTAPEYFK